MTADSGQPGNLVTVKLNWAKVNFNSGIHALWARKCFLQKKIPFKSKVNLPHIKVTFLYFCTIKKIQNAHQ